MTFARVHRVGQCVLQANAVGQLEVERLLVDLALVLVRIACRLQYVFTRTSLMPGVTWPFSTQSGAGAAAAFDTAGAVPAEAAGAVPPAVAAGGVPATVNANAPSFGSPSSPETLCQTTV
jgi:hypothetical protein